MRFLGLTLRLALILFPLAHLSAAPLDLATLFPFKGPRFRIIQSGTSIGTAQLVSVSANHMVLNFNVSVAIAHVQGNVAIDFKSSDKLNSIYVLNYSGSYNGVPEKATENVKIENYMLQGGILTFHYLSEKRFLQITLNSQKQTAVSTDWGTAILIPER